jgi:hypothetical protein
MKYDTAGNSGVGDIKPFDDPHVLYATAIVSASSTSCSAALDLSVLLKWPKCKLLPVPKHSNKPLRFALNSSLLFR